MRKAGRQRSHAKPNAQKSASLDDARSRVMVIDDDSTVRAMLQAALEKKYSVVGVRSGEDVIELIDSHDPNILILDINLPGSDGFAICREIRSKAKLKTLPILFMTVRKDDESFVSSLGAGGNSFITKPFEMPELREKIEHLLHGSL